MPLYLLINPTVFSNLYINGVHGWALVVSTIVYLVGLFLFNGMIISIMTNAIGQRVMKHRQGLIHYLKSGHYIIMGYDDMVPSIISHIFKDDPQAFVLVLSAAGTPYIKEKLKRIYSGQQLKHIIVNYGHRTSKDYYKDIHLESSVEVFIVGLRSLPAHDAVNVECVDSICDYLEQPEVKGRPRRITCVFEDLDTYAAFKTSEIFGRVKNLGIAFMPYNFYAGWAKQVFVEQYHRDRNRAGHEVAYPAVYGKGYSPDDNKTLTIDDPRHIHLVFVGTTNFAIAFAIEAANILHFPNFCRDKRLKTLITFIDKNADKEKDEFITRNRHFFQLQPYYYCDLSQGQAYESKEKHKRHEYVCPGTGGRHADGSSDFLDVEFQFIKGDIFSMQMQSLIQGWAKDKEHQYLSIFITLSDQRQNFAISMNMPDEVYLRQIPLFIRQDRSDNFVSNLRQADNDILHNNKKNTYVKVVNGVATEKTLPGRYANIYPFGMYQTAYCADNTSLWRAKLINYLYCTMTSSGKFQDIAALDGMNKDDIRSDAERLWHQLPVALKWSNLYSAYTIPSKLAILRSMRGLALDNNSHDTQPLIEDEVRLMAQVEHNRWNVEKLLMGYRKPQKDEDKYENPQHAEALKKNKERFIHHDIRPYRKLDKVKQLDEEFSRYIPWIIRTSL